MPWIAYGDSAYLLECQSSASASATAEAIRQKKMANVVDVWAAFSRLCVVVDPVAFDPAHLPSEVLGDELIGEGRVIAIPVDYSKGLDLPEICEILGLSESEFISLHAGVEYSVQAIGFAPGFAYLGPLDARISRVARLETPRKRVAAGSVAITEGMTAIYPSDGPGGWRVVGRTPRPMVSGDLEGMAIQPTDRVVFRPITASRFLELEEAGEW